MTEGQKSSVETDASHREFLAELNDARSELSKKLRRAEELELDQGVQHVSGRDSSEIDLQLAELIIAIRVDLNSIVDRIESNCGQELAIGMHVAHMANEIHNARHALRLAQVQHERLGFVVDQLTAKSHDDG